MSATIATARIYIVDDSDVVRRRVAEMLADSGMRIIGEAATPQSAIDGILASHPDVVVLDAQLKGGSGLDVLRAIVGTGGAPAFVVFSNTAHEIYRRRYLSAGADTYLDKTAESDRLGQAVRDAAQARISVKPEATANPASHHAASAS